jgi:hypothetical protein
MTCHSSFRKRIMMLGYALAGREVSLGLFLAHLRSHGTAIASSPDRIEMPFNCLLSADESNGRKYA